MRTVTSALVTGGGSGVGAAIALDLAQKGAQVTITGRRRAALEAIAAQHENIHPHIADVTDMAAMQEAMAEHTAHAGAPELVVANAGAATSAPFAKISAADWAQMLAVNLTGTFNTFQAALGVMDRATPARLVAVASTAGLRGYAYVAPYCAAKHGVVGLVRALAQELAKSKITVNAICPSYIDTPMVDETVDNIVAKTGLSAEVARAQLVAQNPQKRLITPDEIAAAVQYLCSIGAAGINGHTLSINGGEI
ncbi:MAG: SDR family NAD(P)-dependent oxidoreductase [Paracoccaceae bacterium]